MHLKVQHRGGRDYLSIVQSYRDGKRTRTRTVETIGYADDYADRYPDPIAHFRAHVEQLNALRDEGAAVPLSFGREEQIGEGRQRSARLGSAVALGCLDALGIAGFFNARRGRPDFPAQAGRVFEMLAAERMMHVASKRESWERRASFPRSCDFDYADVYAALDCFSAQRESICRAMAISYERLGNAYDTSRIYLVVSAFPFAASGEIDTGEDGGAGRATAWIALALDGASMPLSYYLYGEAPDAASLARWAERARNDFGAGRVVVVAGRLAEAELAMRALAARGHGFVLFEDVGASDDLRAWARDPDGYVDSRQGNFHMKARAGRLPALGPALPEVPLKEVVLRSRGYACVACSETNLSPGGIFNIYRELWRLAEPFQVMEADFAPVPYPVSHASHVRAHFVICYAAFFALRMLRQHMGWAHNAAHVADALLHMEGTCLQANWFLFTYRSPVTDDIERACSIPVARRIRTPDDIRQSIGSTQRALRAEDLPAKKP